MIPSIVEAEYRGDFRIHLRFSDGSAGTVDFSPWLRGPVFEPLRNPGFFQRFFVDGGTVSWPNGADIAPETLYEEVRAQGAAQPGVPGGWRYAPPLNRKGVGGTMKRLGIAVLVLLASCAAQLGGKQRTLLDLPPDFGPIAWTTSPADIVRTRQTETPVVWVGQIANFTYVQRADGLVLEWVCDSLPFAVPGADAIRRRPIAVGSEGNGRFLVNLIQVQMTEDAANTLKRQYDVVPHYVLVAGTVDSVVDRDGLPTVFVYTKAFELSKSLVTHAQ
jgi:hypothetical protein